MTSTAARSNVLNFVYLNWWNEDVESNCCVHKMVSQIDPRILNGFHAPKLDCAIASGKSVTFFRYLSWASVAQTTCLCPPSCVCVPVIFLAVKDIYIHTTVYSMPSNSFTFSLFQFFFFFISINLIYPIHSIYLQKKKNQQITFGLNSTPAILKMHWFSCEIFSRQT